MSNFERSFFTWCITLIVAALGVAVFGVNHLEHRVSALEKTCAAQVNQVKP
jgi:hypothetical protein